MEYKKILTVITVGFVALLLFFTFFSRTLADLHVPMVSLTFPQQGSIRPEAVSHGIITPGDTYRIFAPASGRITQIVEPGDDINRSTILFTITNDLQTLYDSIAAEEHQLRVANLNLSRTRDELSAEQQRLNQMLAEPATLPIRPTLNLFEFDLQLEGNAADIERVHGDIANLEFLYSQGIIPRQDIINRQNEIVRLEEAREQILQRREQSIRDYEDSVYRYYDSVGGAERNRETGIQNQRNRISQINFTINGHNMEIDRIQRRIRDLTEQLEDGGTVEVTLDEYAFANHRVIELMPGVTLGSNVHEGMAIMETSLRNNRFIIEASFPQADRFIEENQTVDVMIANDRFEGRTISVTPTGARNTVEIEITSNALRGGEWASVTVSGGVSTHPTILPLSAVHEDTNGYFILFLDVEERRFGGNHYIVRSMQVEVVRRDTSRVAITSRFFGLDLPSGPIILNSDIPIQPNMRVRPADGTDFSPAR